MFDHANWGQILLARSIEESNVLILPMKGSYILTRVY